MKKNVLLFIVFLPFLSISQEISETYRKYNWYTDLGARYYSEGKYPFADSLMSLGLTFSEPTARTLFITSLIKLNLGDTTLAFEFLKKACLKGLPLEKILSHKDFKTLKTKPKFEYFINITYPQLHKNYTCSLDFDAYNSFYEIISIDQIMRRYYYQYKNISGISTTDLSRNDTLVFYKLNQYIKLYGYPTVEKIGYRFLDLYRLQLQHLAHEQPWCRDSINKWITIGLQSGDLLPAYYSEIVDYQREDSSLGHLYSTDFFLVDSLTKERYLKPIYEIYNVDTRRKKIGLFPLYFLMQTWSIKRIPYGYNFDIVEFEKRIRMEMIEDSKENIEKK